MLRRAAPTAQRAPLKRIFTGRRPSSRAMLQLDTPALDRFAAALLQPATLAERGVHAPFTTPALFATRLRHAPARGLEVLLASPSGRPGWLVLPWPAALDACRPSLADRALVALLAGRALTPDTLRDAAREVAAGGLAGRAARRAALATPSGGNGLAGFARDLLLFAPRAPSEEDRRRAAELAATLAAAMGAAAGVEAARAAWLLDGWGLLAALWRPAEPEARASLLRRFAVLAPAPSEDMLGWPGCGALAPAPPPPAGGAPLRFATQPQCEAALASWLAAP